MNESLAHGENYRQTEWTESIAIGSKSFIEAIKEKLGILAKGLRIIEKEGEIQLREEMGTYNAVFDSKKEETGAKNAYLWNVMT